jgi:AcrR family transcriptional regulator
MTKRTAPALALESVPPTKGEITRAKLLQAAHELFLKQGFHGTSMREIADEAGIAVGGIYNHYGTKEEIFAAVLDAYHPYHVILPALEDVEGETVEEFVRDAAQRMRAGIAGVETRLLPLVFMDLVEFQGRHLRQLVQTTLPRSLAFFQRLTERQGRLRAVPFPVMLRTFMSLMVGFLLTEMILKDVKNLPQLKTGKSDPLEGMLDIYLHGILDE